MRWLVLLLLFPLVHATVAIYAKGFSPECYVYRSEVEELLPQSPFILASFLRDSGFDVDVVTSTEGLERYDGVIVLACTEMTAEDVGNILRFFEGGGGLLIDAREFSPILRELGVEKKSYPLDGLRRGSLDTVYVTVKNAVLVSSPIREIGGPLIYGYEKMYYVGEPLALPADFKSGFVTESGEDVLGWKVEGVKRLVVTGCLYCSDPLLLANLVDWIEDGVVDFPRFSIYRRVVPDVVYPGSTLVDLITIRAERELSSVRGEYVYGYGEPYCDFGEPSPEFAPPQLRGNEYEIEVKFAYTAKGEPRTCYLPPVLLTLESAFGSRRVIVDPVEVTVSGRDIMVVPTVNFSLPLAALGILVVALGWLTRRELRKRYLLTEWKKYRDLIALTKKRRLLGELSEESYKDMLKNYEERLQEIEVELKMMGVNPAEAAGKGRQGGHRAGHRQAGRKG